MNRGDAMPAPRDKVAGIGRQHFMPVKNGSKVGDLAAVKEGWHSGPPCPPRRRIWHYVGQKMVARLFSILIAAAITGISANAWSQAHQQELGPYILRGSTVSSETLNPQTAKVHGIERDPRRGVLNVTVLKRLPDGTEKTVSAQVHAQARDLTGQEREIRMREATANGYISYFGGYDFVRREVLDFSITAKPEGASQPLNLTFRDRLWLQ